MHSINGNFARLRELTITERYRWSSRAFEILAEYRKSVPENSIRNQISLNAAEHNSCVVTDFFIITEASQFYFFAFQLWMHLYVPVNWTNKSVFNRKKKNQIVYIVQRSNWKLKTKSTPTIVQRQQYTCEYARPVLAYTLKIIPVIATHTTFESSKYRRMCTEFRKESCSFCWIIMCGLSGLNFTWVRGIDSTFPNATSWRNERPWR